MPGPDDIAFLLPALFIFGRMNGARALLGDADTGWHIRTGEWILANGRVPTRDLFSFTMPEAPWFAWEWLSEIAMALVHRAGGLPAIVFGSVLLLGVTALLLYRLTLHACRSPAIALAVTCFATVGSAVHWLARPHLFTLLLAVVFLRALQLLPPRRLWWLPLLMVVWTNLHGGFILGILFLVMRALGEWLNALLAGRDQRALKDGNHYAVLAVLCAAATLVNPYWWHLHQHLLRYLSDPAFFKDIQEFQPIGADNPLRRFYEPMLFAACAAIPFHLKRRHYGEAMLLTLWAHMSMSAARHIPVFLMVAAPLVGSALAAGLGTINVAVAGRFQAAMRRVAGARSWHVASGAAMLLLWLGLSAQAPVPRLEADFDPGLYPARAVAELHTVDRVFTDDEWGDYLIYSSRAAIRVFVDGRSDFYGPGFEARYQDILHCRQNWQATLRDAGVNTLLVRADSELARALAGKPEWQQVYHDSVALVFRSSPR